jgi:putative flippase GtrA
MSIARQGVSFLIVGGCLIVVDWAIFVAFTAIGVQPPLANLAGRLAGAFLGYWANGRITFMTGETSTLGRRSFTRFAASWLVVTALSTYMVTIVAEYLGLKTAWLAKPLVDGSLAVLTFFVSRHWVYR